MARIPATSGRISRCARAYLPDRSQQRAAAFPQPRVGCGLFSRHRGNRRQRCRYQCCKLRSGGDVDSALDIIDAAIKQVSGERSKLGAVQNRLEHTIANLDNAAENLQAAESRIRDVDMAQEMMNFTKFQILQQASTAMLAQANLAPQSVLQLLG